jgi:hypothetical protein
MEEEMKVGQEKNTESREIKDQQRIANTMLNPHAGAAVAVMLILLPFNLKLRPCGTLKGYIRWSLRLPPLPMSRGYRRRSWREKYQRICDSPFEHSQNASSRRRFSPRTNSSSSLGTTALGEPWPPWQPVFCGIWQLGKHSCEIFVPFVRTLALILPSVRSGTISRFLERIVRCLIFSELLLAPKCLLYAS